MNTMTEEKDQQLEKQNIIVQNFFYKQNNSSTYAGLNTWLHFPSSLIEARDAICQRPLLKIAQQVWYTHKHKSVEAKVCTIMSSTKLAIVVIVQRLKQDTPWNRKFS